MCIQLLGSVVAPQHRMGLLVIGDVCVAHNYLAAVHLMGTATRHYACWVLHVAPCLLHALA